MLETFELEHKPINLSSAFESSSTRYYIDLVLFIVLLHVEDIHLSVLLQELCDSCTDDFNLKKTTIFLTYYESKLSPCRCAFGGFGVNQPPGMPHRRTFMFRCKFKYTILQCVSTQLVKLNSVSHQLNVIFVKKKKNKQWHELYYL